MEVFRTHGKIYEASAAQMFKVSIETVTKGRKSEMPAHKDFLGEGKVHVLAAYVYSLSAGKPGGTATAK